MNIKISIATELHVPYAEEICVEYEASAKVRGTGIAKRSPEYVIKKMLAGDAVIALEDDKFVGFCYIESFENKKCSTMFTSVLSENYLVVLIYRS